MSVVGVANVEQDVAQALLDLQSNVRDNNTEQGNVKSLSDTTEDMERTAKFFLSCFITSQLEKSTKLAIAKPEILRNDGSSVAEVFANKRSSVFNVIPSKHYTASLKKINNNRTGRSDLKVKTRDVGTQTEDKYQLPMIETMEFTIKRLCKKIKSLENQIKSNSEVVQPRNQNVSEHDYDMQDDDNTSNDNNKSYSHCETTLNDESMSDSDDDYSNVNAPFTRMNQQPKTDKVLRNRNMNSNSDDVVSLGDGNAMIPSRIFRHINWNSYTSATRKLLTAVFSRKVLATHSLTGKPSPAFPNKPAKKKLDPALVNDIVQTVVDRCCVPENVVRTSITTKCADESKMFRTRQQNKKKRRKCKINRENIPPESESD